MKPKSLGYAGENAAAHFLQNKGYEILANNFTIRGGEIDLVARKGALIIFVEVKTRTGEAFGHGDEAWNGLKKRRFHNAANRWLAKNFPMSDPDYRVDLIEISLDGTSGQLKTIEHFEDIE